MSRLQRALRLFAVLGLLLNISPHLAYAADPNLAIIADHLKEFSQKIDSLGSFEELGEQIPLTSQTLTDGLKLADLFKDSLKSKLDTITQYADTTELANAIDHADTTVGGPSGVLITFSNVTVSETAFPGFIDVVFTANATRTINVPLSLSKDAVNLDGGQLSIDLALSTTLNFRLDKNMVATDPAHAFFIVGEPTINIDANANGTITGFTTNLGFTQISVGGSAALDLDVDITFQDPDGLLYNGQKRITSDELTSTALADLFTIGVVDDPLTNAVDASIALDTCLINGCAAPPSTPPDVTYAIVDQSLVDGFQIPSPNLGNLGDFTNIDPAEMLSGISQLAAGLLSAQSKADPQLPFLQESISSALVVAEPVINFIKLQGDAAIICGAQDVDPPTGSVLTAAPGDAVFCQAIALKNPTAVRWTPGAGANATSLDTVGVNPTKNVAITLPSNGFAGVQVEFGDANVVCGTTDADPPTGDVANVPAGGTVYCQATTTENPTSVSWNIANGAKGANTSGASALATVGTNPTQNAVFTLPGGGRPRVYVQFGNILSGFEGETHVVTPRFRSAEELLTKLLELAGFQNTGDNLKYDSATHSLTFRLKKSFDPRPVAGQLNFGDQLSEKTNLIGLSEDSGASASIDASNVSMDVSFGVILVDDVNQIVPSGTVADRFFLKVGNAAGQHEFTADLNVDATVKLKGRVGFLEVTAQGDAAQKPSGGDPTKVLEIGRGDATNPMLAIDIDTDLDNVGGDDGIPIQGAATIADAIRIRRLVDNLDKSISPVCNIKLAAGIAVNANVGSSQLGAGGVAIDWPNVFPQSCKPNPDTLVVNPTLEFEQNFKRFDIDPSLFGTHTGAADALSLTDANQTAFSEALTGRTLKNKTDNSKCTISLVDVPGKTVQCVLSGGTDNNWDPGDKYEITGNPFALLGQILDTLDQLAAAIDNLPGDTVATEALNTKLPIVGTSPKELIKQLKQLRVTVDDLRTGMPIVKCGTTDANPPTGDISNVAAGTKIYCQATNSRSVSAATWTITGGSVDANGSGDAAKNTISPAPSDTVEFTVTATQGIADPDPGSDEFSIKLAYTDAIGEHSAAVPSTAVATLQGLELAIEEKLGLPAQALNFELTDLPPSEGVGKHTGGDNSTTLTDANNNNFTVDWVGGTLKNTTDGTSCTINDVNVPAKTISCTTPLDWDTNDTYAIQDNVKDLVVRLGYGICTSGNTLVGACSPNDVQITKPQIPLNLDLGTRGLAQVEVAGESKLDLEFAARAQLDFAIALALKFNANTIRIIDTSGVSVEAGAKIDNLNLSASIGPLTVKLGSGVVPNLQGTHDGANDQPNLTDSNANFSNVPANVVLENVTDGTSCVVTAVAPTTLTCATALDWDAGDAYRLIGGKARIRTGFTLARDELTPSVDNDETFSIPNFVSGLHAALIQPANSDTCGVVDPDGTGPKASAVMTGDACAKLALGLGAGSSIEYLGDVGFSAPNITSPAGWTFSTPDNLETKIASTLLDWTLLLRALEEALISFEQKLDGSTTDSKLPLIGKSLDGGAEVVKTIREKVVSPVADLADQIKNISNQDGDSDTDPDDIEIFVKNGINNLIGDDSPTAGLTLLRDRDNDNDIDADDVTVTTLCGSAECANGADLTAVSDIRVTFQIGQDAVAKQLPFDVGLPGLPLGASGNVKTSVGWDLLLDFGLSRDEGPYFVTDGAGHSDAATPELTVGAAVELGDNPDPANCAVDGNTDPRLPQGFSTTRCLQGQLAFLNITLRDGDTPGGDPSNDRTSLSVQAGVNLKKQTACNGASCVNKLSLQNLLAGQAKVAFSLTADANVDLRFRTGLGEGPDLPSVIGAFHLTWGFSKTIDTSGSTESDSTPLSVEFDGLHLDAGAFITRFVQPIVTEVKKVTSPLQPVIDTVRAPLPVLSDVAALVGEPPVTLIGLMEAISDNDLSLIKSIIAFVSFVNTGIPSDQSILIPLGNSPGSFTLDANKIRQSAVTPDQASSLITSMDNRGGLIDDLGGLGANKPEGAFGVPGLSFPFLDNSSQIFGLLLGKDVVVVRYEAGNLSATAGFSYTFGPIMAGPVPISITLSGSATIKGRFAIGYDTSGLRQVIQGGSAARLLDGIFIDDLDRNGVDVPEIQLIGTVAVAAGVDFGVVSAGVEGGIRMTVNLNLNDSPDPDGKLRIDEIVDKLQNPICLFDVSGKLEAFLGVYVRIGFAFFSKTFRFTIVSVTLLDFSGKCEPPKPVLAQAKSSGSTVLLLNMGSQARRNARQIRTDVIDEEFTVRPLEGGGFSVAAFGVYQEYPGFTSVEADGDNGKDIIALEPGAKSTDGPDEGTDPDPIPFAAPATIKGGVGDDQIKTGGGNDTIYGDNGAGGSGNDKINAGGGNDTVYGEGGDDDISGNIGTDTIEGGANDDAISGGPGGDFLYGQDGNDEISGGPGTNTPINASQGFVDGNIDPGPNPDEGDKIVGGNGADDIEGNFGADTLYGDEELTCDQAGSAAEPNNDQVQGGPGNDTINGGAGNDVLLGEEGNDIICGNGGDDLVDGDDDSSDTPDGNDTMNGGPGDDDMFGRGGGDTMSGGPNNDDMSGGLGADSMSGGDGRDYMFGDGGKAERPAGQVDASAVVFSEASGDGDTIYGEANADVMYGEGGADTMNGGDGADEMYGNGGNDTMNGNAEVDTMRGGQQDDAMHGNEGSDVMFGDSGDDDMFGDSGDDTMRGNSDDDYMEGNQDVDTMYGDGGQDDMIGGSSTAGTPDAGDFMYGSASFDVMAGDNAQITRPGGTNTFDGSVKRDVTLLDIDSSDATLSGADVMYGNEANDLMYGQGSGDTMNGSGGDDYMEGNAGDDYLYGNEGQDDMIGGSGAAGRLDGADHIWGGSNGPDLPSDFDVIMGDNATITRPLDGAGQWQTNTFNGGIVRTTTLFDVAVAGGPPVSAAFSGGDQLFGEGNDDLMYGQGGGDEMHGGTGDDYMEGNAGVDTMFGDAGNDDMVGGTGRINSDGPAGTPGRLDAGDTMHGGTGFDVMAGDNALLVRTLSAGGAWQQNSFNGGIQHNPRILLDMAMATPSFTPPAGTSGGDTMFGDDNDDLMYGQGGGDEMHGGAGDDFMEGNGDSDTMFGDPDQDDMIGGTVAAGFSDSGDTMSGGDGADVMLGDNGTIDRPLTGGQWVRKTFSADPAVDAANVVDRSITLLDVQTVGGSAISPATSGGDTMFGDGGRDLMFGQGNGAQPNTAGDPPDGVDNDLDGVTDEDNPWTGDKMSGGDGHDYMEGNHGADWMFGDGGEDDMLGGGSSGNGVFPGGTAPTNLRDGNDVMDGGAEDDVLLGDNGRITRPLTGSLWRVLSGFGFNLVVRETSMDTAPLPPAGAFGNDHMRGGADHDDMYGQLGNDYMEGNAGEDAMVGDLGLITNNLLGDGINDPSQLDVFIAPQQPFISDTIFKTGTLYRLVQLYAFTGPGAGVGNDIMFGDDGNDSMHGGPGNDLMNGDGDSLPDGPDADTEPDDPIPATVDEDHLFGGDGNDVMWGGRGHDHLWGGYGADYLDVKPRPATPGFPADPPIWFFVGGTDNFQGIDYIYGGWDQDAMQANIGDAGPVIGDRLIDWAGAYNAYYLCPGLYGDYVATRAIAPGLIEFLQQLAAGDGAVQTATSGSSGFRETAIVFSKDVKQNTSPPHPDNPGHFTCTP